MAEMRTIGVKLRLDYGDYARDAEAAAGATRKLGTGLDGVGVKGKASLDHLASKMTLIGVGLAGIAGLAVKANMEFEHQLSEVGAVANATGDQLDQLRTAAIQAGAATVFSATDAAQAEAELAKAGISTANILGGALDGALSLAAAGQIGLGDAATIAAAAMNTFGLKGRDVGHIADVLAAGANKSAAGVDDLGQGLQQVGLVANQAGLNLDETVGVLAAFADRGLRGSDGATSFKTALQRLIAPTDQARGTLKELGISAYDANGNMVSIVDIAGQLHDKMTTLAPAQRNAALQTIFGSDAIRAANILYGLGAKGVQDYITAVNDQGAASEVASKKMDNLAGDVEQLRGSLDTLAIQSGTGVNAGLRGIAQGATKVVNAFGELPPVVQTSLTVLTGLTGVTLLGTAGAIKLKNAWSQVRDSLNDVGPSGLQLGGRLQTIAKWAGIAAASITALATASTVLDHYFGVDLPTNIDNVTASLQDLATTGKATGDAATIMGADMEHLDRALAALGSGGGRKAQVFFANLADTILPTETLFGDSVDTLQARVSTLDQSLSQMVQTGHGDEASAIFAQIAAEADKMGISVQDLQNGFPSYIAAYRDLTTKTGAGVGTLNSAWAELNATTTNNLAPTEQATVAAQLLAKAFGVASDKADGLTFAMLALNGVELNWREAERQVESAVDGLQEALKASHGSLDVHTEKGRAAAAAVDALAKAAADAAHAKLIETGSTEEAIKTYDAYIAQLRAILLAAGLSKQVVDKLIASIAKMPADVTTTVGVEVKVKVTGTDIAALLHNLEAVGGRTSHQQFRWGGITHAAAGSLRSAAVYAPTAPAMYAFAEPATGGEAFVPRRGSRGRSLSILSAAAGWYGADVVPRGGWYGTAAPSTPAAGGDAGPLTVENHIEIGGEVVRVVRTEISESNRQLRSRVAGRRGR